MFDQEGLPDVRLLRWFLVFGAIGLAVAIALTSLMQSDSFPTHIVLILWPTSMVGLIDPRTFWAQLTVVLITYGGQFVLYACSGLCIGFAIFSVRNSSGELRVPSSLLCAS
jgi:hypothetical protein